ncbi:MAG: hypothetical protein AB1758_01560 [Candidatus Eremiobacterota bacterium]
MSEIAQDNTRNPELNPMIALVMAIFFCTWASIVIWFATPGQQVIHFFWPQMLVP